MIIEEGSAKIDFKEGKLSKKLPVFYNPVMKLNRDMSVLLLNAIDKEDMQIADPLAGSGIRAIRFLKELDKKKIRSIEVNDYKTSENIKMNLKLNGLEKDKRIIIHEGDANLFLLNSKGFDYIDIDPFGTPNPFLDSAAVRIARDGILAVTATDTAALAGASPEACLRKYWAKPLRNEFMHETAIRILIRKVQLIGSQHEKALMPIYSYAKEHYYRVFFRCEKGRQKADEILLQHGYLLYDWKTAKRKIVSDIFNSKRTWDYAGPLWTGQLWDKSLAEEMHKRCQPENKELHTIVSLIKDEATVDSVGFYDLHKMAQMSGKEVKKIEKIVGKGIVRTHFLGWGVRSAKMIKL
jgi:tRNA (guanine26-N2/guanine27-N2)-dimethyltransferase